MKWKFFKRDNKSYNLAFFLPIRVIWACIIIRRFWNTIIWIINIHASLEFPFYRKKKNKRKSLWNTSTFGSPSWTSTTKADWIERVSKLAYFRALSIVSGKCRTPGKILLLLCIFINGSVQKGIQTIQTTSASTRPIRSDRFYSTCWRTL